MKKHILLLLIFTLFTVKLYPAEQCKKEIVARAVLNNTGPIPILQLEGTYYEMGLQYGTLMKDEIHAHTAHLDNLVNEFIAALPDYFKPFVDTVLNSIINKMEKRLSPKYKDEIRGISEGSGIDYKKYIFIAFGGGLLTNGCTSLFVKLPGGLIHGRNFDFEPAFLGKFPIIIQYNPTGKYSYTNFGLVGYPAMFHGVNEKGISIALNLGLKMKKKKNPGLPMGYKIRDILEEAATLEEVDKSFKEYTRTDEAAWIITVGSSSEQTGVIYDIGDDIIKKSDFTHPKYHYALNRFFSTSRTNDQVLSRKYLGLGYGEGEGNLTRLFTMEKMIKNDGINSIDDMIGFLRNNDFYQYKNETANGAHSISCDRSLHTVIFDALNGRVFFAANQGYSPLSKIYSYNLQTGELDLYKEETPLFTEKKTREYLEWFEKYQLLYYTQKYSAIVEMTDFNTLNLSQLRFIYRLWKKEPDIADHTLLLDAANRLLTKYSEYALLHIIKGALLEKTGSIENAITSYENALSKESLVNYNKIYLYYDLFRLYKEKKEREKAAEYGKKYITLFEELDREYKLSKELKKYYRKTKFYSRR